MPAIQPASNKLRRGFACMSPERRREIARKGGASVAPANRSFSRDPKLAAEAGAKGGSAPHSSRGHRAKRSA
jgi:general stress protein YciG